MNLSSPLPHPRALAHLGDAVYELWIRESAIALFQKSDELHRYTTERVKAETQVKLLEVLWPELPESLQELAKRAQNMPVSVGRRSNQGLYRKATAFEAIIGYWYLVEPETMPQHRETVLKALASLFAEPA